MCDRRGAVEHDDQPIEIYKGPFLMNKMLSRALAGSLFIAAGMTAGTAYAAPVTASARSLPLLMCIMPEPMFSNITWIWPPMRSTSAGPLPL